LILDGKKPFDDLSTKNKKYHQGTIKYVEILDEYGNILVSGGRDGKIILYDIR
jgi:hypothetical protein